MDIGSIFLILAVFVPAAIFIARPLLERKTVRLSEEEHQLSHWLAEQERTLTALQELDFDYALGKIPEEDYPPTRAWMIQQGVEIMRKLDELQPAPIAEKVEDRLEAAIATRRAERAAAAPAGGNGHRTVVAPDDNVEALIAARRRERNGASGGFCPKCGGAVQKADQFCPKCGARLKTAV